MTRGNRTLSMLVLLGLLTAGFDGAARAQAGDKKTFTISGLTGLAGVKMQGLPGNVVTDENGAYSIQVPADWTGTVKPTKPGYVFEPPARRYELIGKNLTKEDFTARKGPFVISGTVGLPGVKFKSLPGDPVSDDQGRFSIEVPSDLNGYVMPIKEGYAFDPPFIAFGPTSRIDTVHFRPRVLTFTISGQTGVAGVLMQGLPQEPVTDQQGRYRAQVSYGWSGAVIPRKEGFIFSPPRRTYTSVTADLSDGNYTTQERMVTISNRVLANDKPIPGIRFTAEPGGYSAVTDSQGRYTLQVPYGWSGGLMGTKRDWDIEPGPYYDNVTSDIIDGKVATQPNQERMVTISDVVKLGVEPIQGVTVRANPGGYSAVTDADGRYSLKLPYGWSGYLTMSKPDFDFQGQVEYVNVTGDVIDRKSVPAPESWPPLPTGAPQAGGPGSKGDVLVIPTRDVVPEKVAETREDLRVMLQILREKLSEPRMILGVLRDYGSFFGDDRRAEALYFQGTAAVFVIKVDFPYSFPTQRPDANEVQKEAVDPVWQKAKERLSAPGGSRAYGQSSQSQGMTFEQFQDELLRSLRHAANVRHIDPNERIILTIVAQDEDAGWSGSAAAGGSYSGSIHGGWAMGGGSSSGGGSFDYRTGSYGSSRTFSGARPGRTGTPVQETSAAPAVTVLTMQAKKADVDAFARGDLDFAQFRQKVKTFAY